MITYEIVLTLFAAMFGGAFGSFLNVVIWRLPLGMSLSKPDSHCPRCKHPIRFYDNLPILGWLLLRGRCRDCHLPISVRYPLVETICFCLAGTLFFAIIQGWTGSFDSILYWNGLFEWKNLPPLSVLMPGAMQRGDESMILTAFVITACRFFPMYLLLCIGFIQYDGNRIPRSILIVCFLMFVLEAAVSFWLWNQMTTGFSQVPVELLPPFSRLLREVGIVLVMGIFTCFLLKKEDRFSWLLILVTIIPVWGITGQVHSGTIEIFLPYLAVISAPILNLILAKMTKKSCPGLILFVLVALFMLC